MIAGAIAPPQAENACDKVPQRPSPVERSFPFMEYAWPSPGGVLAAAFLPSLFAAPAKAGGDGHDCGNRAPRGFPDRLVGTA